MLRHLQKLRGYRCGPNGAVFSKRFADTQGNRAAGAGWPSTGQRGQGGEPLHTEEHLILEKIGFREETVTTHFGVIDFTGQDGISDIRNWHYRFLDSDLY